MTNVKTPKYVLHDDGRWQVVAAIELDGEPGFDLKRVGKIPYGRIVAKAAECVPDDHPRVRRFKDGSYVLEFDERGVMYIRQARRSKRYPTSLKAIFEQTVRAAVAMEKFRKKARRRK